MPRCTVVGWPEHDDFEGWVSLLASPHRASQAYWHLVLSPIALPIVREGLKSSNAEVRRHCARVLDHLADEASFEQLLDVLGDPDPQVRGEVLHAIACDRCKGEVCTPEKEQVLPRAIDLLREDSDKYVRSMAAEVVGKWAHEDNTASDALAAARDLDPEPSVRKKAGWFAPGGTIYRKTAPKVGRI